MNPIISRDIEEIISTQFLPWEKLSGKTIFISGASGFLPAYLVHTLLKLNDLKKLDQPLRVLGLVRNEEKAKQVFQDYLTRKDFELIVQDISDPLDTIAEEIHYIIHAASQASPKFYGVDPVGTLSANVLGTYHLLQLARSNPIESFLYFSSGEVYGQPLIENALLDEKSYGYLDPMNVRACYGESKRMGETMCVSWWHQHQIPIKVVRPFHTYGPGLQLDDGRVFADFVRDIVNNQDIVLNSDGSAVRAFCYIADATVGFFSVLFHGLSGEAYNVGNPEGAISILELAELLISLFPEKNLKLIKNNVSQKLAYMPSKITHNIPSILKIKELGWQPKCSLKEGFEKTIQSFLK